MNPQVAPPEVTESAAAGTTTEQYRFTGEDVIEKIKQIVHEGNVRRVLIKNADGRVIVEFTLTVGVVGAALAPMWAAVGAVVALVADCTIEIERSDKSDKSEILEK